MYNNNNTIPIHTPWPRSLHHTDALFVICFARHIRSYTIHSHNHTQSHAEKSSVKLAVEQIQQHVHPTLPITLSLREGASNESVQSNPYAIANESWITKMVEQIILHLEYSHAVARVWKSHKRVNVNPHLSHREVVPCDDRIELKSPRNSCFCFPVQLIYIS
jgi:hypothetical protein